MTIPQMRAPAQLKAALALREDAEILTDKYGATVYRQLVWPPKMICIGGAHEEEIAILRGLVAGGDLAHVIGPMESFVIAAGPTATMLMEALREDLVEASYG